MNRVVSKRPIEVVGYTLAFVAFVMLVLCLGAVMVTRMCEYSREISQATSDYICTNVIMKIVFVAIGLFGIVGFGTLIDFGISKCRNGSKFDFDDQQSILENEVCAEDALNTEKELKSDGDGSAKIVDTKLIFDTCDDEIIERKTYLYEKSF